MRSKYTVAANAILNVLDAWVVANVPDILGYKQQALAAMPAIAGAAAKATVDALNSMENKPLGAKPSEMELEEWVLENRKLRRLPPPGPQHFGEVTDDNRGEH